jgi:D-glycero-D-manno-heptose 1,7-bisphosphate phosphatase
MNKALFLDRDGVINHDPGDYTFSLEEFILLPTVLDALKLASDKGYKIIIITNQGGIAKGLYKEEEVHKMHTYLKQECEKIGVTITDIFFSPYHSDLSNSLSRKPGSLMMERAIHRHKIDVNKSVMIGDRDRDIICAAAVGVKGIKIPTNAALIDYIRGLEG